MALGDAISKGVDIYSIFGGDSQMADILGLGSAAWGAWSAGDDAQRSADLYEQQLADQRAVIQNEMGYRNLVRDRMLAETGGLRESLSAAAQNLGPYSQGLDPNQFELRANQIMGNNLQALDAVVNRVNSESRASLLNTGLADGTTHEANRQAEMMARFAPLVNKTLDDARTQALAEYTGLNKDIAKNRKNALEEISYIYGEPLEYEAKLLGDNPSSAMNSLSSTMSDFQTFMDENAAGANTAYGDRMKAAKDRIAARNTNTSFSRNVSGLTNDGWGETMYL